jgi:hypothetical protein
MDGGRSPKQTTRAETTQSLLLWLGILTGPLAWSLQTFVAPDLAEVLCYAGAAASGRAELYGFPIEQFIVVLTALLAAATIGAGIGSFSCLRRLRRSTHSTDGGRAAWMARAGILVSVLFLMGILLAPLPVVFVEGCVTSP